MKKLWMFYTQYSFKVQNTVQFQVCYLLCIKHLTVNQIIGVLPSCSEPTLTFLPRQNSLLRAWHGSWKTMLLSWRHVTNWMQKLNKPSHRLLCNLLGNQSLESQLIFSPLLLIVLDFRRGRRIKVSSVGDSEVKLVSEYIKRTKTWVFGFLRHGLRK